MFDGGLGMLIKSMGIDPVALMNQFNEFQSKTKEVAIQVASKVEDMDARTKRIEAMLLKMQADQQSMIVGVLPAGETK